MPSTRNPHQALREAHQIANTHGCFVSEKHSGRSTFYLLYRRTSPPTLIGQRSTPNGLRTLVCKACNIN